MEKISNATRTIENPIVGDRVTFLETAEETGGSYEHIECVLSPGGGNPPHYHTGFTEEFTGVEGILHVECDGKLLKIGPGQSVVVNRNSIHCFYNPGKEAVTFRSKVFPASNFELSLRIAYGLARDGRTNKKSVPYNPLVLAVLLHLMASEIPNMPSIVKVGLLKPLYRIARLVGIEDRLTRRYGRM